MPPFKGGPRKCQSVYASQLKKDLPLVVCAAIWGRGIIFTIIIIFVLLFPAGENPRRFWWKGGVISHLGAGYEGGDESAGTLTGKVWSRHPCYRCLIKAQTAASVGPTGPSLDSAKKNELGDRPSGKEKGCLRAPPVLRHAQLS